MLLKYIIIHTGVNIPVIFEAAKSGSGWTSHKMRALKDRDGTDDEEEQNSSEHVQAITVDFLADSWTTQDCRQEQMNDEDIGPILMAKEKVFLFNNLINKVDNLSLIHI